MNFRIGRYYLSNGMRAVIKSIEGWTLFGEVNVFDNVWIPTYWNLSGNSKNKDCNITKCIEGHEDEEIKWDTTG